jgi:hypothetical protein
MTPPHAGFDSPADDGSNIPLAIIQILQVQVPGECHEDVGQDEQTSSAQNDQHQFAHTKQGVRSPRNIELRRRCEQGEYRSTGAAQRVADSKALPVHLATLGARVDRDLARQRAGLELSPTSPLFSRNQTRVSPFTFATYENAL